MEKTMLLLSHFFGLNFQCSVFILLIVSLNIEVTMASENLEHTQMLVSQAEPSPPVQAKKKDPRRRSECGVAPSIWTLNLCETHKFCYLNPEQVKFWQPKHKRARGTKRLLLKNTQTQQKIELTWTASEETLDWPIDTMPVESGAGYLILLKKRRIYFEREIFLYQVPNHLETATEKMNWMTQQGCVWQVEMLKKEVEMLKKEQE